MGVQSVASIVGKLSFQMRMPKASSRNTGSTRKHWTVAHYHNPCRSSSRSRPWPVLEPTWRNHANLCGTSQSRGSWAILSNRCAPSIVLPRPRPCTQQNRPLACEPHAVGDSVAKLRPTVNQCTGAPTSSASQGVGQAQLTRSSNCHQLHR